MTPALDHIAPGEELKKNTSLTHQALWIGARKLPVRAVTEVTPNRTFCLFGTFSVTFSGSTDGTRAQNTTWLAEGFMAEGLKGSMAACTQLPRQAELSSNVTDDAGKPNELPLAAAVSDALSSAAREAAPTGSSVGVRRDWEQNHRRRDSDIGTTEDVIEYDAAAADLDAALALIESDLDAAIENPNPMTQAAPELPQVPLQQCDSASQPAGMALYA